ncbi:MAG TPA: glycosyltransferase family 39 protein [Methylomirabilota bacterium]|nr:glycosyltransferase family 39 protein [Methylomirabilota bacterium]
MARRLPLVLTAAVVVAAAPWLLIGLGAAPFDDPGEGMHAEIARELRAGGHPLDLRLNGVRYVDKPPLLYVLLAGAFAVAGESEAVARAVPAVAALAGVGAVAWLGTRLLGPAGGVLAGGALLSSIGFYAYGRYVRPETLFVAALAWGFALALVGLVEARPALVVAGLAGFGLAALAKDPLGALGPPAILGLGLALGGRARPLRRWLPAGGVVAAVALGFGWWALVELRSPGFTWYTVVDNHLLNVARARHFPDEDVPLSALEFLIVAGVGAAPWIITAAVAVVALLRRGRWREPGEAPWLVLALWALAVLGLTTLSAFRLPHYGLPAYPAIALLAARGWLQGPRRALIFMHLVAFAALAVACGMLWAGSSEQFASQVLDATDVATRKAAEAGHATAPPWETIRLLLGATALIFTVAAGGLGFLALGHARAAGPWAPALVLATMIAVLPAVGAGLAAVAAHRAVRTLAMEVARQAAPNDLIVHEGPLENSGALEWYAQRRPVIVDGRRSVLAFGATFDGAADVLWERERLRQAWDGRRVWLVTVRAPARSVAAELPGARLVAEAGGRRLYVNR